MKIRRTNKGVTEYLAALPLSVLGEDGITVDHVETAWTANEASAFDFAPFLINRDRGRGVLEQLEGTGAEFFPPLDVETLPEPTRPNATPPAPAVRVERKDTPEGVALRERMAAERAAREAEERTASEAAEKDEKQ